MCARKRPTPRQINLALGIATAVVLVAMSVHFGTNDPSYRIQAGMLLGALGGTLFTRLFMQVDADNRQAPHRAPYY